MGRCCGGERVCASRVALVEGRRLESRREKCRRTPQEAGMIEDIPERQKRYVETA